MIFEFLNGGATDTYVLDFGTLEFEARCHDAVTRNQHDIYRSKLLRNVSDVIVCLRHPRCKKQLYPWASQPTVPTQQLQQQQQTTTSINNRHK